MKPSFTKGTLGIDFDLFKKRIEYQNNSETNWKTIEDGHIKPVSLFDISVDEELSKTLNWNNTWPSNKEVHRSSA